MQPHVDILLLYTSKHSIGFSMLWSSNRMLKNLQFLQQKTLHYETAWDMILKTWVAIGKFRRCNLVWPFLESELQMYIQYSIGFSMLWSGNKLNAQEPSVPTTENITLWNSLGYDPQDFCPSVANGKIRRSNLVWQWFIISKTCALLYRTHIGQERYWKQSIFQSAHVKFEFVFNSVAYIY